MGLIREQDPLKQGLKPLMNITNPKSENSIREQDPLKQGLKLSKVDCVNLLLFIREQDPLKQGLKHIHFFSSSFCLEDS